MIKLTRLDNWHTALTHYINEERTEGFEWGTHDCALWAADCVHVITGVDFAKDARGTYNTPIGAYKTLLKVYGVENLKEVFSSRFVEQPICYARPGDVVFQNSNYEGFNVGIGICNGKHSFFVNDYETGLEEFDTLDLDGCFWIG